MSEDIYVVAKMPNGKDYTITIHHNASVQDALEKLITDTSITLNEDVDKSLFLLHKLNPSTQLDTHQLIEPTDFAKTTIQDLIQKSESTVELKFKVPDTSTNLYCGMDKNQINLQDIMVPKLPNFTEFEKITDNVSLLKFCQKKNKQKIKSYADYNKAQKIAFWRTIIDNILDKGTKLSLETVFEFHIFVCGNKRIEVEDFEGELSGKWYPEIFLCSEYLDVQGYKKKDKKDEIESMKPIFDFINQHRKKYEDRDNTLNYINLIDFFCNMCDEKFTWQDILDLKLINLENADDFKKLGSDGLDSIINILDYCLSKNSNDQKAITAIKNIFANVPNSVATIDQIVQLLNLCEKNKIDLKMDENMVTKLFKEIENEKCLTNDNLLLICSFCKDNSIPEDIMKNMMDRCPSDDLLTPTFIRYVKSKTKFNIGSNFHLRHSLAVYNIVTVFRCYKLNKGKKMNYNKGDFIGLFSFIDRDSICSRDKIALYRFYRKNKNFGDIGSFAKDILNAKNTLDESENEINQNNKLTLAELHVIFFSDFSFNNQNYNISDQQFKNMIPDEIDFGYLKFLLLFYSERNKLTNENIIFCFEKYKIDIDKSLDNILSYLNINYVKIPDKNRNDLVCELFDVYIKNRNIQPNSDDFNKAEEAKNKYLMKECLKTTTTEKENQQTIIDFNKNKVSNNEIEYGNACNQSNLSKKIDNGIKNNNSQNESDSKSSNADDSSSMTTLKIIGHIFTFGIFIWGPFLFNAIFGGCCSCIKTYDESEGNSLIDSTEKNNHSEGRGKDENRGIKGHDYI